MGLLIHDLSKQIARERARLARLERLQRVTQARHAELERQTAAEHLLPQSPALSGLTGAEKVALFRALFRGRDDVYPRLWINAKTHRSGYAPACANEWVRDVCGKPRVKCGDCPNQRFLPVSDRVLLDHLRGRHVAGVYPLLRDETCWFIAADFDGATWRDDVTAFRRSCRSTGLSPSVERSRSGEGAHVWFFFREPVPALVARQMVCFLLTEAMQSRSQMRLQSYDPLFPNQDTMPKGGFGNLIALPLQWAARQRGNTVFLDDQFVPFPDQWVYLRTVERLERGRVEAIAGEAARAGRVLSVRALWEGKAHPQPPIIVEKPPGPVRCVLAQEVFIEKRGVPSPMLRQIQNLAAFQNPEFYKRQNLRLSTHATPRIIECASDLPEHVGLPRGCFEALQGYLASHPIALEVQDKRVLGQPLPLRFRGTLREEQRKAVEAALAHDIGTVVAPPGAGKTVVGAALIARRCRSTLVLVHRTPLLEQWVAQLTTFLNVQPGTQGAGKSALTGKIDVAMLQSAVRGTDVQPWVAQYGYVVVDECHHLPAVSFERVLRAVQARYVTGLTATFQRRDGHQPIVSMQVGPVRHTIAPARFAGRKGVHHRLLIRRTDFHVPVGGSSIAIQRLYAMLAADERRNDLIFDDVLSALEQGRSPIVLTERTDHLRYLAARFTGFARNVVTLQGGTRTKVRQETLVRLAAIPADAERLVLATGRYAGEGFDDARFDTLFLVMPIAWKGTLVQYAGRLHRESAGKREVRIYDYVDTHVPVLARMFEKRRRGYRAMGYEEADDSVLHLGIRE